MFSRACSKMHCQSCTQIFQRPESLRKLFRISLDINCCDQQPCRAPDDDEKLVFFQDEVPVDIPHVCICILWPVQCRGLETPPEVSPSLHVPKGEHCTHSISSLGFGLYLSQVKAQEIVCGSLKPGISPVHLYKFSK